MSLTHSLLTHTQTHSPYPLFRCITVLYSCTESPNVPSSSSGFRPYRNTACRKKKEYVRSAARSSLAWRESARP